MLRRSATRIWSMLNVPLFGTKVIPRDAAVDPTAFPEDEYPVTCPKCGYLLRGLPDSQCPECGKPFERGRLLVQQYVKNIPWKHTSAGKWMWRLVCLALVVQALGFLGFWIAKNFAPTALRSQGNRYGLYALGLSLLVSLLAYLTALSILLVAAPRGIRSRRRAVVDAIWQQQQSSS